MELPAVVVVVAANWVGHFFTGEFVFRLIYPVRETFGWI